MLILLLATVFRISQAVSSLTERINVLEKATNLLTKADEAMEKIRQHGEDISNMLYSVSAENLTAQFEVRINELEKQLKHEQAVIQKLGDCCETTKNHLALFNIHRADEKFFRKRVEQSLNTVEQNEQGRREDYQEITQDLQRRLDDVQRRASELDNSFISASRDMTEAKERYNGLLSEIENKMEDMVESTFAMKTTQGKLFRPKTGL